MATCLLFQNSFRLDALYDMTLEELWKPIFVAGYEHQFVAIKPLHPEFREDGTVNRKLVGRAVTAAYVPIRPDYYAASCAIAKEQGWNGTPNQWVIDSLQNRDVLVVDMYDNVSRILISKANIQKAIDLVPSPNLGVTMCQANYLAMGENVYDCIEHFGKQGKIFFVHFRDIAGNGECFHETFHDNGPTDMVKALKCYQSVGFDGPIRVDHVPTMAGEANGRPGYESMGRLYAIGYLRGLAEAIGYPLR